MAEEQLNQGAPGGRPGAVRAGFMVRLAASIYDLGLVFALAFLVFIPVTVAEHALGSIPQWSKGVLVVIVFWAYFAGFWSRSGQTTGMRPWRLMVVMAGTGEIPDLAAASLRFAALLATWLAAGFVIFSILTGRTDSELYATVALLPFASLLCILFTSDRRALHDLLSGSIVVRLDAPQGNVKSRGDQA